MMIHTNTTKKSLRASRSLTFVQSIFTKPGCFISFSATFGLADVSEIFSVGPSVLRVAAS